MDDISLVICGSAGQGIQTIEKFLVGILKLEGYNVFATKEVMSRVRGGINSTELRISSKRVSAYVERIDILITLQKGAIKHLNHRITDLTKIIINKDEKIEDVIQNPENLFKLPFKEIAENIGSKIYSSTVVAGIIAGLFNTKLENGNNYLNSIFKSKGNEIIESNITAFNKGYEQGNKIRQDNKLSVELHRDTKIQDEILFNGNQAVALGAIAGGCNFISAYPMSPSTGVLIFLAQNSEEFGIVIDQAEDEIAAINKAIGAWYAGARAIASTSGGGFALMTEGLSLAGMIESPLVIHIAQRPGPATGLPTRTGQEDLNLALYGGHGEFPRLIFAPGTIEQAFHLTQKAFNLADRFQIPVFILTDQYFVDSYYNIPNFDISDVKVEHNIVKSEANYKRYKYTENGISPRSIPSYGVGIVRVDSDEHTEEGLITEDLRDTRIKMNSKRIFQKNKILLENSFEPEIVGSKNYKNLIICWGSNYHVVKEAIEIFNNTNVAMIHFSQVFPLHPITKSLLSKAENVYSIENNATGQFSSLLKLKVDIDIPKENQFLKFSGEPFSVEEIINFLKKKLNMEGK